MFHIFCLVLVPQGTGSGGSATPIAPCQNTCIALQGQLDKDPLMVFAGGLYQKLSYTEQCRCLMGASQVHLTHTTSAGSSLHSAQMSVTCILSNCQGVLCRSKMQKCLGTRVCLISHASPPHLYLLLHTKITEGTAKVRLKV